MSEQLDSELVERALQGDAHALQDVLRVLRPRLLAYLQRRMPLELRRLLGPDDVLQDVWPEAFMRIHAFRPNGPDAFYRWLATIALNRLKDLIRAHRSQKRGGGKVIGNGDEPTVAALSQLAVYSRTPSASAADHEFMAAITRAMGVVPNFPGGAQKLGIIPSVVGRHF